MVVFVVFDCGGLFNVFDFYMKKLVVFLVVKGKVDICKLVIENIKIFSECLGFFVDELNIVVMDCVCYKDLIVEICVIGVCI